MHPEKAQNLFIALLAAGLLIVGTGVYVMSQQLLSVSKSVKNIERGMMENRAAVAQPVPTPVPTSVPATETYSGWDLSFNYPGTWYVVLFTDADGQKSLRLTSSPGQLESLASLAGPSEANVPSFEHGFQANMSKAIGAGDMPLEPTKYANIMKVTGECDAMSCPTESYLFTAGTRASYWIRFVYTDQSYAKYVDGILSTLKESR